MLYIFIFCQHPTFYIPAALPVAQPKVRAVKFVGSDYLTGAPVVTTTSIIFSSSKSTG